MSRDVANQVETALLRAQRDAEITIARATRRAIDRERAAFERARSQTVIQEREILSSQRELALRFAGVQSAYGRFAESMARVARTVATIGEDDWPDIPTWPAESRSRMELSWEESHRLSVRLEGPVAEGGLDRFNAQSAVDSAGLDVRGHEQGRAAPAASERAATRFSRGLDE